MLTEYRLDIRDRLRAEVPEAFYDLGIQPGFYPGISPDQFRHAVRWGTGPCPGQVTDPWTPPGFIIPPETRGLEQAKSRHGTSYTCPLPIFRPNMVTEYHGLDCDIQARGYRILSMVLAQQLVLLREITGKEPERTTRTAECSCGSWYGGM
jgi:hypothetical protein